MPYEIAKSICKAVSAGRVSPDIGAVIQPLCVRRKMDAQAARFEFFDQVIIAEFNRPHINLSCQLYNGQLFRLA